MPVIKTLLVEGKLDAQILGPIFKGDPAIPPEVSSKNALAPKARDEQRKGLRVFYIRDRNYDFDPPTDCSTPHVDQIDRDRKDAVLGWRWCRHSMENYMLEPSIVSAATGIDAGEYRRALQTAANEIRYYQAARWTKGIARRALPPSHKYQTCPEGTEDNDWFLPESLSEASSWEWVQTSSGDFYRNISEALNEHTLSGQFQEMCALFSDDFFPSVDRILLWFSGKNLIKAMEPWISSKMYRNPGDFRA